MRQQPRGYPAAATLTSNPSMFSFPEGVDEISKSPHFWPLLLREPEQGAKRFTSISRFCACNKRKRLPLTPSLQRGKQEPERAAQLGSGCPRLQRAPVLHPVEGSWGVPTLGHRCGATPTQTLTLCFLTLAVPPASRRAGVGFLGFIRAQVKAGCFPKSVPSGCSPLSPSRLPDSHAGSRGERSFPCCIRVICLGASQMMEIKYLPFGAKSSGSKVGVMSGAGLSRKQLLPSCGRGDGHGP